MTARMTDATAVVRVPALLSVATVARLLDCSPRTVRRRIAARTLPAVIDHGRVMVRGDDLRGYIDGLERVSGTRARQSRRSPSGRYDFSPRHDMIGRLPSHVTTKVAGRRWSVPGRDPQEPSPVSAETVAPEGAR
jgi:hypothetical protein